MKKSLLALAAITAFTGVASAQSSVTLFGVVDLAARNTKNGSQSIQSLTHGGNATSRLGFRGVEDLGGGLRAGFWIEGEVVPDTGNPAGMTWQRRSTVSLMGGFGEVRLGRDYTPSFWNHVIFDPFGFIGVGGNSSVISTLGSGAGTLVRANNSIGYFLPAMGGIYGQVMVTAGENASPAAAAPLNTWNKYLGARIGYAAGPVNVAVAYGKTDRGTLADFKDLNAGASYNLGFMTLMARYGKTEAGAVEQTNAQFGATVPLGAGTFKASYTKASGTGTSFDATLMAVGYVYDLSKRTALYTAFSRVNNDGTAAAGARFTAGGAGPAFPAVNGGGLTSTGYEFGVRHNF